MVRTFANQFGPVSERASEEYNRIVFAKLDTGTYPPSSGSVGHRGIPRSWPSVRAYWSSISRRPARVALKRVLEAVTGLDMVEAFRVTQSSVPNCRD